jgi:hypothetical protein
MSCVFARLLKLLLAEFPDLEQSTFDFPSSICFVQQSMLIDHLVLQGKGDFPSAVDDMITDGQTRTFDRHGTGKYGSRILLDLPRNPEWL